MLAWAKPGLTMVRLCFVCLFLNHTSWRSTGARMGLHWYWRRKAMAQCKLQWDKAGQTDRQLTKGVTSHRLQLECRREPREREGPSTTHWKQLWGSDELRWPGVKFSLFRRQQTHGCLLTQCTQPYILKTFCLLFAEYLLSKPVSHQLRVSHHSSYKKDRIKKLHMYVSKVNTQAW